MKSKKPKLFRWYGIGLNDLYLVVEKTPKILDVVTSILQKEGFKISVDKPLLEKAKRELYKTYDSFISAKHRKNKNRQIFMIAGKNYIHLIWLNVPKSFENKMKYFFKIELKKKWWGW